MKRSTFLGALGVASITPVAVSKQKELTIVDKEEQWLQPIMEAWEKKTAKKEPHRDFAFAIVSSKYFSNIQYAFVRDFKYHLKPEERTFRVFILDPKDYGPNMYDPEGVIYADPKPGLLLDYGYRDVDGMPTIVETYV